MLNTFGAVNLRVVGLFAATVAWQVVDRHALAPHEMYPPVHVAVIVRPAADAGFEAVKTIDTVSPAGTKVGASTTKASLVFAQSG